MGCIDDLGEAGPYLTNEWRSCHSTDNSAGCMVLTCSNVFCAPHGTFKEVGALYMGRDHGQMSSSDTCNSCCNNRCRQLNSQSESAVGNPTASLRQEPSIRNIECSANTAPMSLASSQEPARSRDADTDCRGATRGAARSRDADIGCRGDTRGAARSRNADIGCRGDTRGATSSSAADSYSTCWQTSVKGNAADVPRAVRSGSASRPYYRRWIRSDNRAGILAVLALLLQLPVGRVITGVSAQYPPPLLPPYPPPSYPPPTYSPPPYPPPTYPPPN